MSELDEFDQWVTDLPANIDDVRYTANPDYGLAQFNMVKATVLPQLISELADMARRYRNVSLVQLVQENISRDQFPEVVHAIRSMVGDDEVVTSNSLLYAVLCILLGSIIAKIKISWEDVQMSKYLFNYAEGNILLPPSKDADFESVNKYNKGNGVPFVLDAVRFRDLSCVRKQSNMETDLPSKFGNLAARAAWTNPSWFTWNSHQFALILGIEIFDFARSNMFPYLFKWEAGCGGSPPWNNVLTAGAAIHRFKRGKAQVGLLGIMNDSNRLQRGEIRPEEAFFTKNLNLAMSGDKNWFTIRSELERQKLDALHEDTEWDTKLRIEADKTIPLELQELSAVIDPDDAYTGVAVSFLREKGYILTELDLVEREENELRLKAVWGRVPMRDIEDQIELRKQEYQESFHEKISQLAMLRPDKNVQQALLSISSPLSADSLSIMKDYYTIRVEEALRFNSFIYNERIRIFKMEDVEAHYNRGVIGVKNSFAESIETYYRPEIERAPNLPDVTKLYGEISDWMRSDNLENLLRNPIPPGVGPDDSRIVRDLTTRIENSSGDAFLILLISSDHQLGNSAQRLLDHNSSHKPVRIVRLPVRDYVKYCLASQPKVYKPPGARTLGNTQKFPWINKLIYNPISRKKERISGDLRITLETEAKMLWASKNTQFFIEYDFPNINRTLSRFRYDPETNVIAELTGGFLSTAYLGVAGRFPTKELSRIYKDTEFTRGRDRSVYTGAALQRNSKIRVSEIGRAHV